MNTSEQTLQQIDRFINKIIQKYPETSEENCVLTDIHILVNQESGEMRAYNDDEEEITRCVVEQWIDNKDELFYTHITDILRKILVDKSSIIDKLGILKPYSFVLEDDDHENIAEPYVADDDTIIIGGDLMSDLDEDLDKFLDHLIQT
ncbi:hypothetical protein JHU38_09115 [Prevotella sp. A2931]|uniref:Uncharacterized protein n=1 Tax=Prevotella illustrans TaxID=2800387 RepID=A0ABS3M6X1_9BACT|nr:MULTISPECIES: hypothetical protein [Prevotella]MBO1363927.1 hypothetical protein [Prevotella illustrans]PTL25653.1 hypothetical protein C3V39_00320 [Prevotella sp. oral taxon 820]